MVGSSKRRVLGAAKARPDPICVPVLVLRSSQKINIHTRNDFALEVGNQRGWQR